jgi:predicted nuclease with TOPRIM domain
LDGDLIIEQFGKIEQKVEGLIESFSKIEAENNELKNRVLTLENELNAKQEMENRYQEEKSLVRTKIDGLLAKLDTLAED